MAKIDLNALFAERSAACPIGFAERDASTGPRIGGARPSCFGDAPIPCGACGKPCRYYGTIEHAQALGGHAVSIFFCDDFECLLNRCGASVATPRSLIATWHGPSPRRGRAGEGDAPIPGRALLVGAAEPDVPEPDVDDWDDEPDEDDAGGDEAGYPYPERPDGSKLGGEAGLIQDVHALEDGPKAAGLGFLFQIGELDYPRDYDFGTYVFGGGNLYVFAEFDADGRVKPEGRVEAFWQTT